MHWFVGKWLTPSDGCPPLPAVILAPLPKEAWCWQAARCGYLPIELWQRIAQLMRPEEWCQACGSVCSLFRSIHWQRMSQQRHWRWRHGHELHWHAVWLAACWSSKDFVALRVENRKVHALALRELSRGTACHAVQSFTLYGAEDHRLDITPILSRCVYAMPHLRRLCLYTGVPADVPPPLLQRLTSLRVFGLP